MGESHDLPASDGNTVKVRENLVRRIAARQGYRLEKSRRRDPRALDYGRYNLVDEFTGEYILETQLRVHCWTLSQVQEWLEGHESTTAATDYDPVEMPAPAEEQPAQDPTIPQAILRLYERAHSFSVSTQSDAASDGNAETAGTQ